MVFSKYKKKESSFQGKADNYIKELEEKIVPRISLEIKKYNISYYALMRYSLGWLFAIYTSFKTNIFKRVASISGSLWYPNFLEFIQDNNVNKNIEKIYFSPGNKEKNSRNLLLQTVEDTTKEIASIKKIIFLPSMRKMKEAISKKQKGEQQNE